MQGEKRPTMGRLGLGNTRGVGVLLLLALSVMALTGCSRGSYPLDFFPEMHYNQSYKIQEPPSLSAPTGSVPVTGAEVDYTMAQARLLQNTVSKDQGVTLGAKLFKVHSFIFIYRGSTFSLEVDEFPDGLCSGHGESSVTTSA